MKHQLNTDDWMLWLPGKEARNIIGNLANTLENVIGDPAINHGYNLAGLSQAILTVYTGSLIQPVYAKIFKGMSEEKIDEVMKSFSLKNCKVNDGLVNILKKYTKKEIFF